MIDVEREIFSPIAKAVREAFPGAQVTSEYIKAPSAFPHISIVEYDNYMTGRRLDSADAEKYATIAYEVNVYSNKANGKKSECRAILNLIDQMLYSMNFRRFSFGAFPDLEEGTIYRMTARYRAETDGENLYRI